MFASLLQDFSQRSEKRKIERTSTREAHRLYVEAMTASRTPNFYTDYEVPDTIDGRFDMLALHVSLVILRIRHMHDEAYKDVFERTLIDCMMADMDQSLREQSVGDSGVLRRVQKMGEALFGRIMAYDKQDIDALAHAIQRNIFRNEEEPSEAAKKLADYAITLRTTLGQCEDSAIRIGQVREGRNDII